MGRGPADDKESTFLKSNCKIRVEPGIMTRPDSVTERVRETLPNQPGGETPDAQAR